MPRQHGTSPIEQIARIFGVPLELVMGSTPGIRGHRLRPTAEALAEINELLDEVSPHGSSTGYGKAWPYQGSF